MDDKTGEKLVREVLATASVFLRESHRLFRVHGLTAAQFNVLNILADSNGMSQSAIGEILVVDRSNVTGLVKRMESAGWVKRIPDPDDGRVIRVALTARGKKLLDKVHPLYRNAAAGLARGVSAVEADQTVAVLARLRDGALGWSRPDA